MKLKIFLLFLALFVLGTAGYYMIVQGLLDWPPDFMSASSSRASDMTSDDPALNLIPNPDEWVDYGPILEAGNEGEWDFNLAGMTTAILKPEDGSYYFYYGGSNGYRSFDGGPRHRAVGVATSKDGIHYQKYPDNPVMTHLPHNGEEEGANSAAVTLDQQGNFVMYYGGAAGERETINANGRLAFSQDGFNFTDQGIVMNRINPFLYGFGDEIFPVAAFQHDGRWNVYYHPNGSIKERTLGMVWGGRMDRLPRSTGVLDERSGGIPVFSWGNVIRLSPERIALFIQRLWWPDTFIEVRTASPDAPQRLSEPVTRYDIPNLNRGTAFFDADRRTWFMIYNSFDRFWRLKLAPGGEPDTTPPTKPVNLQAEVSAHDAVRLSWEPASDPDTGVISYKVYQDGVEAGSTIDWSSTVTGLGELTSYTFEVSAVNFHGYEGPRENVSVQTPRDQTVPKLVSASTQGDAAKLVVVFSEPVDNTSAEELTNYTLSPGIQIESASLGDDGKTVTVATSYHTEGTAYTLSVSSISDLARFPNTLTEPASIQYTHSQWAGLVGRWSLDEAAGESARDLSGHANHGSIMGPEWEEGIQGGALRFDGEDDYVLISDHPPLDSLTSGSFTFSAWVRPEERPAGNNTYAVLIRANSHPAYNFGLSYDQEGKYRAQVITGDENFHVLASAPFEPGEWHHLTMVVDVDSSLLHLYVDGEPVDGSPLSYSGNLIILGNKTEGTYPSGEYYIGSTKPDLGAGSFFTQHFVGWIDEVRVYGLALAPAAVRCLAEGCQ